MRSDRLVEVTQKAVGSLCYDERGKLLPVSTLMAWFEESKEAIKLLQGFQGQLKAIVKESGMLRSEILPTLALAIVKQRGRPHINAKKAMPVLLDFFTNEELFEFVTVQKGAMEATLRAKTAKGMKDGRVALLSERLERTGAVERAPSLEKLAIEAVQPPAD